MLLTFTILISGSVFFSFLLKKRIELIFPLWSLAIIAFLYIFSIFSIISIGVYILCTLVCLGIISVFISAIKRKIDLKNILSPGLFVFAFLFVLSWAVNHNRLFSEWDEFSHWGLIVKNLYYLDGLSGVPNAFISFKSYPPAIALFEYLFVFFAKGFSEGAAYHALNVFYFAIMMPLFHKLNWNSFLRVILNMLLVLVFPLICYTNFFVSIYIDAILGILFGYLLLSYYFSEKDLYSYLNIGLTTLVLVLTKASGLGLAFIALIIIIVDMLRIKERKSYKILLAFFSGVIFGKLSWSLYQKVTADVSSLSTNAANGLSLFDVSKLNSILGSFFEYLTKGATYTHLQMSTLAFFFALMLLSYLIWKFGIRENEQQRFYNFALCLFVGSFFYTASLIAVYYINFSTYEAVKLASVTRYLSTYIIGMVIFLVSCWVITEQENKPKKSSLNTPILILFLICITNLTPLMEYTALSPLSVDETINMRSRYAKVEDVADVVGDDDVYFLSIASSGIEYNVCYYLLAPNSILKTNAWSVGLEPYYEGDQWTKIVTPAEWAKRLVEEYNYVYIFRTNELFSENYASLFKNGKDGVQDETLYKITKENGSVLLEAVAY